MTYPLSDAESYARFACSNCGYIHKWNQPCRMHIGHPCPYCGAKSKPRQKCVEFHPNWYWEHSAGCKYESITVIKWPEVSAVIWDK